jgi:hypothetical protein
MKEINESQVQEEVTYSWTSRVVSAYLRPVMMGFGVGPCNLRYMKQSRSLEEKLRNDKTLETDNYRWSGNSVSHFLLWQSRRMQLD